MSEQIEKNGSVQKMKEVSEAGRIDAEVKDGDLGHPVIKVVDEHSSQLQAETNLEKTAFLGQEIADKLAVDTDVKSEDKSNDDVLSFSAIQLGINMVQKANFDDKEVRDNDFEKESYEELENGGTILVTDMKDAQLEDEHFSETPLTLKQEGFGGRYRFQAEGSFDPNYREGDDSGTEETQAAFMKELENFFKEKSLEFKPPKFYGEGLNCLKLWRAVTRLGGYDQVTQCKLWRQVGESFKPPKTCTTVSWSFRCFYEKALLEYEKHKVRTGELQVPVASIPEPVSVDSQVVVSNQASGSGRARRDAAARAMQGWHSQRMLGNGEVGDPIIKEKGSVSLFKKDKHLKSFGQPLKRKKPSSLERAVKVARTKSLKPQVDSMVVDVGAPADWVKINVRRTKDCYEVYALVPGLLREEARLIGQVHVQSDPAGRLIISGEPEQPDNPWGVTPFKKVITLPSRIDPHQTSAVVTLHGQLFVRAPFEQSDL
ncbi:AT-rich interactive domain-containing protein 6 isoform X1 [Dendrobium catenatum]|uniref:AT-rich interactive domain-containing protein 6 isoform X1 n=1 Tax=Dendrobium catenatum TaxID=906689 RepID=UPI0009F3561D|nr:AT-rich interactive domain-containing protein 6 isoform X1 [Dendrobium catenatum]XP_020696911.1 AT-rich interactive domain-containing protein 6 isoform X1 [Dendrobium catenatum]